MDARKVYQLHELLRGRRTALPKLRIMAHLQCSERTVKRVIEFMRDYLRAPLIFDRENGGYRYGDDTYELPGLWFSTEEMLALLSLQKMLAQLGPGLLDQQLAPLKSRIEKLVELEHIGGRELSRIRLLPMARRTTDGSLFQTVVAALLQRQRLKIIYHARSNDTETARLISPQRLAHYRGNWYLDAWCHQREALRSFAMDRIRQAQSLQEAARNVPEADLDKHFAAGYGIFAGTSQHVAVLRFSPERARWVAEECWHPEQQFAWLENGTYELRIPYADPRELLMDILRHVPDVEVVAPEPLRKELLSRLKAGVEKHDSP
jgi:predicted DNA-binding transcriptional regulator YafY